jgi:hypothetical protein
MSDTDDYEQNEESSDDNDSEIESPVTGTFSTPKSSIKQEVILKGLESTVRKGEKGRLITMNSNGRKVNKKDK